MNRATLLASSQDLQKFCILCSLVLPVASLLLKITAAHAFNHLVLTWNMVDQTESFQHLYHVSGVSLAREGEKCSL